MNKILHFLTIFLCLVYSPFFSWAQFPPTDSGWELKFSDEFDSIRPTIVDTSNWSTFFPWGQDGRPEVIKCRDTIVGIDTIKVCDTLIGVNYYQQWYDTTNLPNNSLVIDPTGSGSLKIISWKQNHKTRVTRYYPCGDSLCTDTTCHYAADSTLFCIRHDSVTFNYTTAMLLSKKKFKYGYFELKFKIPQPPTPPATDSGYTIDWWLWAGDGLGHSNEIDMYEIRGMNNLYTNNVHFYSLARPDTDQAGFTGYFGSIDSNWHISALEWAPDRIDFYLDGNHIRSYPFKPDSMIPMPMIVDMDANATNFQDGIDTVNTVFPFQIQVDYVRVYQLKIECDTTRSVCIYAPATYDSIYQSLTFGGGACTPTITPSSNTTFRATDFIELDEGFTADSTVEMLLDVIPCQDDHYYGLRTIPPPNLPQPPPKEFLWRKYYHQ